MPDFPLDVDEADMSEVTLNDIDIYDVGTKIQIGGGVWTGDGVVYIAPLPGEDLTGAWCILQMDTAQWERFLQQTDNVDVRGPGKAILRKSQRLVDAQVSWAVFRRDGFQCRYCGNVLSPLTVDHVILWENGGATVEENLVSACRACNKTRGNMQYEDWIASEQYLKRAKGLTSSVLQANLLLRSRLDILRQITAKPRSR